MLFMLIVSFVLVVYSAEGFPIIYEGCVAISVLVHYFTLASVMWMGAEALLMYKKLVIVFGEDTTKFIVSVSIVCWSTLIPLVIFLKYSFTRGWERNRGGGSRRDKGKCHLSHTFTLLSLPLYRDCREEGWKW